MDFNFSIGSKITKDFILSKVNQETILSHYLGFAIETKKLFVSPFRDDKNPTCGVYKSKSGIVYFHDFATNKHYNCFNVVMEKYNCSYYKALKIIASDFNLIEEQVVKKTKIIPIKEIDTKGSTFLQAEIKEFSEDELEWWSKYGISLKILKKFNVYSCKNVFLNGNLISTSSKNCPIYGYYGGKQKDIELWRMYFPKRKSYRFLGNYPAKKIQGFKQLPKEGKLLVITKSMKDTMTYYSLGITAIAPNSETLFLERKVLDDLKSRFKYIVVHYDNDRAGKYNLAKIRHSYPELNYFFIPNTFEAKDISDFYKKYGREKTIEFLKTNILKLKNNG
jgi:DNA primase